jgi:hypothetical protein
MIGISYPYGTRYINNIPNYYYVNYQLLTDKTFVKYCPLM